MNFGKARVKPAKPKNYNVTDDMIIKAFEKTAGNIGETAAMVDLHRTTILGRMRTSARVRLAREAVCIDRIELAESIIDDNLMAGDLKTAMFVLERLAKDKWNKAVMPQPEAWPEPIGDKPPGI